MKKGFLIVFAMMVSGFYTLPVRADTGGALPNTPINSTKTPEAGAAQNDLSGTPKLVVEFKTSHAEIPSSYTKNLKAFGDYLKANPGATVEIAGYADHTGNAPANASLAKKRADAVKDYLVSHCAVASSRITAEGYGEVSTKSSNSTEAAKQTNRSAVATIVSPKS